ncbi:MAG: hypothetical protein ABSC90_11425 [Acidimicrobiales bacterium]
MTLLILLPVFAWLTKWQLDRALGGNTLSWAYTFEWPLFAGYAVYVWWQLIHDQTTAVTRRIVPGSTGGDGSGDDSRQPGWALSGGRAKNVAIAARSAVDEEAPPRGERFADQTPDEAARLAAYNRYLAELAAADGVEARTPGPTDAAGSTEPAAATDSGVSNR